mgnify:CR=1 FL=1
MAEEQVKLEIEEYALEGHCTPIGPKTWAEFTSHGDIICSKRGGELLFDKDYRDNELGTLLNSAFQQAQIAAKRPHHESTEGIQWLGTYHPIIWNCFVKFGQPNDLNKLASENPAPSLDGEKLAYFRDDNKMAAGIRTAVAAGRYIKRHWPDARDNQIAEMVRIHFPASLQLKFLATLPEMVQAAVHGPQSCMKWDLDEDEYDEHPYNCYSPELGWNLAVLVEGNKVRSRALVQTADKVFVRTFSDADANRATACPELAAQLVALGYTKSANWIGYKIAKIEENNSCDYLFPYIDGSCRTVFDNGDGTWVISDESHKTQFTCENTDGSAEEVELYECDCCGYTTNDSDDLNSTDDGDVCNSCFEDYTWACAGYDWVYTRDEVYCYGDEYYTADGLESRNLVILHDGDIERRDNAFEIDCEYYRESEVARCDHTEDLCRRDDLVQIKRGSKVFLVQEEYVEEYENEGWSQ